MTEITVITPEEGRIRLEIGAASTLMQVLLAYKSGIVAAECGGAAACATCHVYLDQATFDQLDRPARAEADMLEFAEAEVRPTSRLSCQVPAKALTCETCVEIAGCD